MAKTEETLTVITDSPITLPTDTTDSPVSTTNDLGSSSTETLVSEMVGIIHHNTEIIQELLRDTTQNSIDRINRAHQEAIVQIENHFLSEAANLQDTVSKCITNTNSLLTQKLQTTRLTLANLKKDVGNTSSITSNGARIKKQ